MDCLDSRPPGVNALSVKLVHEDGSCASAVEADSVSNRTARQVVRTQNRADAVAQGVGDGAEGGGSHWRPIFTAE
jgi:hypothetical protein